MLQSTASDGSPADGTAGVAKSRMQYNVRNCGGVNVHGTEKCVLLDNGSRACICRPLPGNYDYGLWMSILMAAKMTKCHLVDKGTAGINDRWKAAADIFYKQPGIDKYQPALSPQIKKQYEISFNFVIRVSLCTGIDRSCVVTDFKKITGRDDGFDNHPR